MFLTLIEATTSQPKKPRTLKIPLTHEQLEKLLLDDIPCTSASKPKSERKAPKHSLPRQKGCNINVPTLSEHSSPNSLIAQGGG